jgi:hypothetical protein
MNSIVQVPLGVELRLRKLITILSPSGGEQSCYKLYDYV